MRQIDGDKVTDNLIARYQISLRTFTRYLVEFAFGEIYARDGNLEQSKVSRRDRFTCDDGGLRCATRDARSRWFNVAMTEGEIVEAVMTLIPYSASRRH